MTHHAHHATDHPAGLHDPIPFGYRHTTTVPSGAEVVLVAGQYGSDEHGRVASPAFADQVARAFANLGRALAGYGLDLGDVVQLRTYVVGHDVERLGVIGAAVGERWGGAPPVNTIVGVAGLALPEILFEVEAVAVRR